MSNYDEIEEARLWDEYKDEQADWTPDIGGEFSAVFADEQSHHEADPEYMAMYSPVEQGFYDDDPNPYHGDYAEDDGY
ncbi:MAG TPA: hypothetical protein VGP24_01145 [Glaciihabitans sp.]|jgi:hypothetical protein|nr:hypothetical protein [Glaciihabitans sp.]